jgi:polysaccharide deacetylase family protein (PEP-CTERM system associated)
VPAHRESTVNALSIDVEDYFQVEAFAISPLDWPRFAFRVEKNVELILNILAKSATKGTFFVLGWIAERFPELARRIAGCGHEIGCHGYGHQHIRRQTPEQFREDIHRARELLMAQVQRPILCYRAPSFSVTQSTIWALDIMGEEGFRIDSSIFPVRHDIYGMPDSKRFPHWRNGILEFPPTTLRIAKTNIGMGGGGYLRLFPYQFTRWAIRRINAVEGQPAMVYFHPWELDPDQPRISAPMKSRLRHYTNLGGMQMKIERLLRDFRFSTVTDVLATETKLSPIFQP